MKKIIFLIIFSFFFLHFVDASQVYLDSILSQEDLISLNQQISFLEENYGIKLKFIVEDTDQLAIGQSFLYFHILHLDEGEMKNWNLLVFYNIQRNELRFVTYKECSIGNKDLENIKNRSIDDIIQLYRYGYRLEEFPNYPDNPEHNTAVLQTCPEGCVLQSEVDRSYRSGLYLGITLGVVWGIMAGTVISFLVAKRTPSIYPTTESPTAE